MLQKVQIILNDALTPYGVASHRLQLYYLVLTYNIGVSGPVSLYNQSLDQTHNNWKHFHAVFRFSSRQNLLTSYSKIWEKNTFNTGIKYFTFAQLFSTCQQVQRKDKTNGEFQRRWVVSSPQTQMTHTDLMLGLLLPNTWQIARDRPGSNELILAAV